MQLSEQLIDLLEDALVSGLRLKLGDIDKFKERFREDSVSFLVSLVLSAKKGALKWSMTTRTLWDTVGDENLEKARKLIEEWEREPVVNH